LGGLCEGRVVIVTGAGRGIGRAHALEFARQGARVVVNDVGAALDGTGRSDEPATEVVEEIRALGGEAVTNGEDVSDWEGSRRLFDGTLERWGEVHVLVNNAGILRDRMIVNMTPEEWDAVIRVHLRGAFAMSHHAAAHWRARAKAGEPVDARIINTTSPAGLYGGPGQSNYGAAKAGLAMFTIVLSMELAQYGVTVNAISPGAMTRMTATLRRPDGAPPRENPLMGPESIAPLVVWLGSPESKGITGRVFNVHGGEISVAEGWVKGPSADKGSRWDPAELGVVVPELVARARPNAGITGEVPAPSA
jgi:NAD(P)-dependent dehydrogenase (short-subunit alcohol dehydrogenase family)